MLLSLHSRSISPQLTCCVSICLSYGPRISILGCIKSSNGAQLPVEYDSVATYDSVVTYITVLHTAIKCQLWAASRAEAATAHSCRLKYETVAMASCNAIFQQLHEVKVTLGRVRSALLSFVQLTSTCLLKFGHLVSWRHACLSLAVTDIDVHDWCCFLLRHVSIRFFYV